MIKNSLIVLPLLLFMFGVEGFSQTNSIVESLHTHKQSKVNLEILGVSYQRESPISEKNTFVLRGGMLFNFIVTGGGLTGDGDNFGYTLSPLLVLGSRHYYRLLPSSLAYKRNFGSYIGFDAGLRALPIVKKNIDQNAVLFILPYWGIQRRIGGSGSFELGLGIAAKRILDTTDSGILFSPNIQIRVGWFL